MTDSLLTTLKKLRLSGLAESLEIRLHEAATAGLAHREFLELLLQDELLVRGGYGESGILWTYFRVFSSAADPVGALVSFGAFSRVARR